MDEILTPIMLLLMIFMVYKYQLYKNSLKVNSCTLIYKPE